MNKWTIGIIMSDCLELGDNDDIVKSCGTYVLPIIQDLDNYFCIFSIFLIIWIHLIIQKLEVSLTFVK